MTRGAAVGSVMIAAAVLVAGARPARAQTCPRYRIEVRSEGGDAHRLVTCAVGPILIWARFDPVDRDDAAPTEDLGDRSILVVSRVGPGEGPSSVREDFYPRAAGGPLVYAAPGQIFSHPVFGGRYTVPGGWARLDSNAPAANVLRNLGVAIPAVAPTPSADASPSAPLGSDGVSTEPAPTPPTTPTGGSTPPSGPDIVTLLFIGVLIAGILLWVIRRRSPTEGTG
ncbi:MAG: hypothetical protein ACXWXS_11560 [Actinomycetota bacterium]